MSLDEEALEAVANGGSIDLEKWAGMVAPLLERLEDIVYNVFPMPKVPSGSYDHQQSQNPSQNSETTTVPPESSNKENTAPGDLQTPQARASSPPSSERVPDSQPQSSTQSNNSLPPPLALLLSSIESAIRFFFVDKPPHTIQRLAELILRPTAHYRTLPAYLRAVDRVVSVTSGADVFPFSTPANATANAQQNGLVHSINNASTYLPPDYTGLGSDESLGGALLTPIPWLANASFEAEDVTALGEEQAAPAQLQTPENDGNNVATTTATTPTTFTDVEEAAHRAGQRASASPPAESADVVPHARGPALLGVEDMGLQDGKGLEMNLGDQAAQDATENRISDAPAAEGSTEASHAPDGDGDIVLDDTKPTEEKSKTEISTAIPPTSEGPEAAAGSAVAPESEKKD